MHSSLSYKVMPLIESLRYLTTLLVLLVLAVTLTLFAKKRNPKVFKPTLAKIVLTILLLGILKTLSEPAEAFSLLWYLHIHSFTTLTSLSYKARRFLISASLILSNILIIYLSYLLVSLFVGNRKFKIKFKTSHESSGEKHGTTHKESFYARLTNFVLKHKLLINITFSFTLLFTLFLIFLISHSFITDHFFSPDTNTLYATHWLTIFISSLSFTIALAIIYVFLTIKLHLLQKQDLRLRMRKAFLLASAFTIVVLLIYLLDGISSINSDKCFKTLALGIFYSILAPEQIEQPFFICLLTFIIVFCIPAVLLEYINVTTSLIAFSSQRFKSLTLRVITIFYSIFFLILTSISYLYLMLFLTYFPCAVGS